jgi:hypothetical protein
MDAISSPIRDALASSWRSAALLVGLGLTAIGAASTVDGLGVGRAARDLRVALEALPAPNSGVEWTPEVATPTALRSDATRELLGLLSLTAWAVVAVAGCSILVLSAGRARARRIEVPLRRAVGATRRQLLGAFAGEGAILALCAVSAGVALGSVGASRAAGSWPGATASWHPISVGVVATIAIVIVLGALFPIGYSWARRVAEIPPAPPSLVLASIQLAVALTVLVASSLLQNRAARMVGAAGVPAAAGDGSWYRVDLARLEPHARSRAYAGLLSDLTADRGVGLASISSPGALVGIGTVDFLETDCGNCLVGGIYLQWRVLRATYHSASADTFYARGVPIADGRNFTVQDTVGAKRVAIVNRYLAARYFEGGRALGRTVWLGGRVSGAGYEVVGVVDDGRPSGFGGGLLPREAVYLSSLQHPPAVADLLVRPAGAAPATAGAGPVARALGGLPDSLPERAYLAREAAPVSWFARWFRLQGWAALMLATAGLLGLMRLWVEALRPELALRRAVGARRRRIAGFVLARASVTGIRGIAIAVLFFGPFLWGELARLAPGAPTLPIPLVARFGVLLAGAALLGAGLPAMIASRRPPAADLG